LFADSRYYVRYVPNGLHCNHFSGVISGGQTMTLAAPLPGDYIASFDECALLHSEPAVGNDSHDVPASAVAILDE